MDIVIRNLNEMLSEHNSPEAQNAVGELHELAQWCAANKGNRTGHPKWDIVGGNVDLDINGVEECELFINAKNGDTYIFAQFDASVEGHRPSNIDPSVGQDSEPILTIDLKNLETYSDGGNNSVIMPTVGQPETDIETIINYINQ